MPPLFPPSHVVPATAPHTHTVIFLHGKGSSATEFCSEIFESQDSCDRFFTQLFPGVKWVFPCAKIEDGDGYRWFDITDTQNTQEDSASQGPGLFESRTRLLATIHEEAQQVPTSNIIVAGISQGCATALYTLLSMDICVGGFFGLCGWLPLAGELVKLCGPSKGANDTRTMPILLQHSRDDDVVPVVNGKLMCVCLEEIGMNVEWQQFEEGGHWLNEPEGMDGIVEFIGGVMAKPI